MLKLKLAPLFLLFLLASCDSGRNPISFQGAGSCVGDDTDYSSSLFEDYENRELLTPKKLKKAAYQILGQDLVLSSVEVHIDKPSFALELQSQNINEKEIKEVFVENPAPVGAASSRVFETPVVTENTLSTVANEVPDHLKKLALNKKCLHNLTPETKLSSSFQVPIGAALKDDGNIQFSDEGLSYNIKIGPELENIFESQVSLGTQSKPFDLDKLKFEILIEEAKRHQTIQRTLTQEELKIVNFDPNVIGIEEKERFKALKASVPTEKDIESIFKNIIINFLYLDEEQNSLIKLRYKIQSSISNDK